MHRGKINKIQFILCWILLVGYFTIARGLIIPKGRDKRTIPSNASSPSIILQGTLMAPPENKRDEKILNCNSTATPNITFTINININDTENTTKTLNVIDEKSNLMKHDNLEGFHDINRIKKDFLLLEIVAPSPKILKKKETGHGKILLLSSIISNGNVINGNIDPNNYDHNNNKRNTKDEANHVWKYRKPIKFQKIVKPSLDTTVNNQDTSKIIYEIYNKNPNHGGEIHDNKKIASILPSRFVTVNSNLLVDYLFPSMFKNIFSQVNREYLSSPQSSPFNEIGYTDKLLDSWFNIKEDNPVTAKCSCNRLRKLDDFDVNSKMNYPKDKFGLFHILPHDEMEKQQDNHYINANVKDLSDKSMILSL